MKDFIEEKKTSPSDRNETAELLEKYKGQVEDGDVHSYSELLHHEYYDYSDSNCCC